MNELLDKIRLASILTIIGAIGGLYCLVTGQITYQEFGVGLGALTAGSAAIGQVRNKAGKGTRQGIPTE